MSGLVRWLTAGNPSIYTLQGTNTYLVGDPEGRDLVCIDPGPHDAAHLAAVRDAGGGRIRQILLTHRHPDHVAGAPALAETLGIGISAAAPEGLTGARPLADGEIVRASGASLRVVATPGHSSDHICFYLEEERALLTGDHILGWGTTVIPFPDGNLAAYMDSLKRLLRLDLGRLYPGHGPVIEDGRAKVEEYLAHRTDREAQILAGLAAGDGSARELVARIYVDVDPRLHPAAELSVLAHLTKLVAEGRLEQTGHNDYRLRR